MKTIFFAVSALALFVMTACKDPSDGTGSGTGTLPEAPFVEGGVSFILSPDKRIITVKVKTAVGNVTVEGCEETTLTSDTEAELHAQGTRVTLKGDITELKCDNNQLISLNVQGLTALRYLGCWSNQLTAQAFTKLFTDLPQRQDSACCILYTETGVTESNHTNFTAPPDLANAFNNAKTNKKWKMYKIDGSWRGVEL